MNRIIEDVVGGLIEKELEVQNIELIRNYDANLPETMVDPDQIRQVIQNLINNATDAIEGSGKITVTTRVEDHKVKVIVSDTGKGIARRRFKIIFNPGYTSKPRGWGLGLTLSRRIVNDYHKGHIFVKNSVVGEGTTFRIILKKKKK